MRRHFGNQASNRRWFWAAVLIALAPMRATAGPPQDSNPTGSHSLIGLYDRMEAGAGLPSSAGIIRRAGGEPAPRDAAVERSQVDEDRASSEAEPGGPGLPGTIPDPITGEPTLDVALPRAEAVEGPGPAFLQELLGLEELPFTFRGWFQNSFSGNPADPPDRINFGEFPNYQANQWQGNQYYLIVERIARQEGRADLGFRVDGFLGNDWIFTKSYGFADEAFDVGQFSGIDIPQFFAELHLPLFTDRGLDIRGGRWYSPAGFEAVQAIERPLFSVTNLMTFTPFTFFGVLGIQHLDERTDVYLGAVNGWDRFLNANYVWNTLAGLTRESADGRTRLSAFTVVGPNQLPFFPSANSTFLPVGVRTSPEVAGLTNFGYSRSNRFYASFVLTREWSDRLTQAMEVAWVVDENTPLMRGPGSRQTGARNTRQDTEWYGFGNWFLYEIDPKLTAVWRSEIFRDDDGIIFGTTSDTYYEMTLGLICKPRLWFWVRPEVRFDWSQTGTPYDDGRSGSQVTLNVDAILLY
ncbi:outer membrane beta-barrel protein [Tautonia sp. JC769]|uniref:outer membrane beta-barrel protein n=1 Tax=Tautonia sp. JC769 TaxID=3232135 RepID=UPI003458A862